MFSLTKKISSYIAIAICISVVGGGPGLIRDAHAALTPAEISARITALSGLAPSDISEIYAVDRAAFVIILASDIPIPLVLEPNSSYLLIKVAATGEWTRIFIDLTEWNSDFVPYFVEQGVETHSQSSGSVNSNTPAEEAAQIATVASVTGAEVADLILNGAPPVSSTVNYSYDALGRLKTITYPDGKVVTFDYDELGNRKTMTITGSQ